MHIKNKLKEQLTMIKLAQWLSSTRPITTDLRQLSLTANNITAKLTNQTIRLTTTSHLTPMMISVEIVERSVIINDNSPLQNYTHLNDQTTLSHVFVFVFHYFFTFVYDSLASFISILMVFIRDLISMESLKHQFWESSINLSHWNIICCFRSFSWDSTRRFWRMNVQTG